MGEAELDINRKLLTVHSVIFLYGTVASDALSRQVASDIAMHWNGASAGIIIKGVPCQVHFNIEGIWAKSLTPAMVYENNNPRNNYIRVEEYVHTEVSFVDGLGCNTGYFKLDNLLNNSTTAAHEYGHTLGLDHPEVLDIRGSGVPGIMYPRGTIVDPPFQYNPMAAPLEPGGTINPFTRKVLMQDIQNLGLHKLHFNERGLAVAGAFSSVWHDAHQPA